MAQKKNTPIVQNNIQCTAAPELVATSSHTAIPMPRVTCHVLGYTSRKPKGLVLQNAIPTEVATPTCKRGFAMPKFWGLMRSHPSLMVLGGMGQAVTSPARLLACFEHPARLLRFKTQTTDFLDSPTGIQTLIATTPGTASSVIAGAPAAIPPDHLQVEFNIANSVSSSIERDHFVAVHRKLMLALLAINQSQAEG